jgi:hypothetical protein
MNDLSDLTSDEIVKATWLRAVEWSKWPTFVAQPLLPLLFTFYPVWAVCVGVIVATWLWLLFRYRFVSYRLASYAAVWVRLKWPMILVFGIYALWHHQWYRGIAICISHLITMALVPFSPPGQIGVLQKRFMSSVGFDPENVEYNTVMDNLKMTARSFR